MGVIFDLFFICFGEGYDLYSHSIIPGYTVGHVINTIMQIFKKYILKYK